MGHGGGKGRKKKSERDSKCFKTQLRSMQDQGVLWGHPLVSSLHSMWGNPESFNSRPGLLRFRLPPRATPTQSPSHRVSHPMSSGQQIPSRTLTKAPSLSLPQVPGPGEAELLAPVTQVAGGRGDYLRLPSGQS